MTPLTRAPEVPPVRQISVPVRLAVSALALAASAGCMSVSDDAGKPAPSAPAGRQGAAAEPDGGLVGSDARVRTDGRGQKKGKGDKDGRDGADGSSPSPSGSAGSSPGVSPKPGQPDPGPQPPVPTGDGTPTPPDPEPTPTEPPPASPTPDPEPEPSTTPSTQPEGGVDRAAAHREPHAYPQVGPA